MAKEGASNSGLWLGLGAAAVAGATYFYYTQPEDVKALEAKAKKDEEELRSKAREAAEAAKARGDEAYRKGQLKYEEAKVSVQRYFCGHGC
jgi:flagellar biosynthesis/type III secretory pathway protein FliH